MAPDATSDVDSPNQGGRRKGETNISPANVSGPHADTLYRLFQAASHAMALLEDDRLLDWNRAYAELLGFARREEVPMSLGVPDISPPLQPDGQRSEEKAREMRRLAREQGKHEFEWLFRRWDNGAEVLASVWFTAVPREDSSYVYLAGLLDITEQRRREASLSESARRLQNIVENLPTGAVYFEGSTVYLNRAAEGILGYTRDEITTEDDWFEKLYGEQADVLRSLFHMDQEAGFPVPMKVPIRRKDGKVRIIEFAAYRDEGVDGVITVLSDVTEQVRMTETEVQEQRILEKITGGNPLSEVLHDLAHLVELHLPGSCCAIFALDDTRSALELYATTNLPAEVRAEWGTLPLDDSARAPGLFAAFQATEPRITPNLADHPEWQRGAATGAPWAAAGLTACWANSVRISSGVPVGVVALFYREPLQPDAAEWHMLKMSAHVVGLAIQRRQSDDALRRTNDALEARVRERTAELRQANRELEAERARLEAVLQQMPAGVAIIEIGTGRLLMMNEEVCRIWRTSPDNLKRNDEITSLKIARPDGSPYCADELPMRAVRTGEPLDDFEFAIRRDDGTRGVVLASAAPLKDADGNVTAMVISLKDITDLKNTEEALRRLHEELEMQVQERTAELARANRSLRAEIEQRERAEGVSRGQSEVLIRTLDALTTQAATETVLENVLISIATQLGTDGLIFWLYDPDENCLTFRFAFMDGNSITIDTMRAAGAVVTVPCDRMPNWETMRGNRRPKAIYDIPSHPDMPNKAALLKMGAKALLGVPLFLGEELLGSFGIMTREEREWREEEIELAQALGHQIALAVQMDRLATRGRETAILHERNRMAREIHDTLAQGFTSIIIHLQLVEAALTKKPEKALPTLLKTRDIAKESLAEARRSVWALRPNALEGGTLADGLRRLIDSMTDEDRGGTTVRPRVEVSGLPRALPAETENHLLRIGQEALNNAFKYAEATEIHVRVHFDPACLTLTVHDNGKGFTPGDKPRGSGFGHTGMRERTTALGGDLVIESAPGQGAQVTATVPI